MSWFGSSATLRLATTPQRREPRRRVHQCREAAFFTTDFECRAWEALRPGSSRSMAASAIRILLVDDDAAFLESLEALLASDRRLEIVGKALRDRITMSSAVS